MKKGVTIFDNHKIPRKFRKYHRSFYLADKDFELEEGFEYASTDKYSKNHRLLLRILGLQHPDAYPGVDQSFTVYLSPTEYSLKSFKSVRAVQKEQTP